MGAGAGSSLGSGGGATTTGGGGSSARATRSHGSAALAAVQDPERTHWPEPLNTTRPSADLTYPGVACGVPAALDAPVAPVGAAVAPAAAGAAPAWATRIGSLPLAGATAVVLALLMGAQTPAGVACVRTQLPEPEYSVLPPPLEAKPEVVWAPAMPANAVSAAAMATVLRRCTDGGLSLFVIVAVLSRSALQEVLRLPRWRQSAHDVALERQQLTCLHRTRRATMNCCGAGRSLLGMRNAYTVFGVVCAALLFGL